MREGFVALAARGDEHRIAADNGLMRGFAGLRAKDALPQNRLGILEVTLGEQLNFLVGGSKVNNGHLAAQAVKGVIARGDDAAGSVKNKFALGIRLEASEDFIENGNFFGEVLCFALQVSGAVWPAHPCGDAVDAFKAAGFEDRSESRFDLVVTADGGAPEGSKVFCPMGFSGTGHADEGEP